MNIPLVLMLALIHQTSTASGSGETFSQLVQLYQYAETQLNEVKLMFATVMENAALQQKKFSNDLRRETSAYVNDEIQKLEVSAIHNSERIKSKLLSCAEEVDNVIEMAITQFVNILDVAEQMVYGFEDKLRNEPSSDDIDEINDEVDDILDDCKENFEISIVPQVDGLLGQLKNKLVSLRPDLRRCFDEAFN